MHFLRSLLFLCVGGVLTTLVASGVQRPNVTLYINEDAKVGSFVGEVYNKPFKKIMLDNTKYFQLESPTSNRLVVASELDRDSDRQLCSEKGWPQICAHNLIPIINTSSLIFVQVIISDVNDNAPTWSVEFGGQPQPSGYRDGSMLQTLHVNVTESASLGYSVELPIANDPDLGINSIVKYELVKEESEALISGPFRLINSDRPLPGGELRPRIEVQGPLDFEKHQNYSFLLQALDGAGKIGLARVIIHIDDENDNGPIFTHNTKEPFEIEIDEDLQIGEKLPIFARAVDKDSGDFGTVKYRFALSTSDQVRRDFYVNPKTGQLSVKNKLDFDAGGTAQYAFTVVAEDGGNPPNTAEAKIIVRVRDKNDNGPEIRVSPANSGSSSPGQLELMENSEPEKMIATVTVSDPDTGINGQFSCELKSVDGFQLIYQQDVGKLSLYQLVTMRTFNREQQSNYGVTIRCQDQGSPPMTSEKLVPIKITDENDNPPEFPDERINLQTQEGNLPGTVIATVRAMDRDAGENARLSYSIEWPRDQGVNPFSINDEGGLIADVRLDRENNPEGYIFKIWAHDNGDPVFNASTSVEINLVDINDCVPEFQQKNYQFTISEFSLADADRREQNDQSELAEVGWVKATDQDLGNNARISYEILDKNTPFAITSDGKIYAHSPVDREKEGAYLLMVEARDNPTNKSMQLSSQTRVNIVVKDINDNKPEFIYPPQMTAQEWERVKRLSPNQTRPNEISVSWREPKDYRVALIRAKDADDLPENKDIIYSLEDTSNSRVFALDPKTGALTLNHPLSYSSLVSCRCSVIDATDIWAALLCLTVRLPALNGLYELTVKAHNLNDPSMSTLNKLFVRLIDAVATTAKSTKPGLTSPWFERFNEMDQDKLIIVVVTVVTFVVCAILISVICFISRRSATRTGPSARGSRVRNEFLAPGSALIGKEQLFDESHPGLTYTNGNVANGTLSPQPNGFYFDPMATIKLSDQCNSGGTYYPFYVAQGTPNLESPHEFGKLSLT
ncbi:hypothetical protein Ciccas_002157 [Cichlidogyrus casuarinus]|uniref:Cadherin domain-containing protein n=1 Tax=Cichlidogyrus casuarinus TaxID=1844966 RepID=A0ABD2QI42_9PLAT